jgi:hypothetical protein
LKRRGVTAELVHAMDHAELAVSLAADTIVYEQLRLPQFVRIRSRLVETFIEETVPGSLLVGDHAIPAVEFLDLVVVGLKASDACPLTAGQKSTLHRFISMLYGEMSQYCAFCV